jgi:flagellar biosynthesis protein FlhF
VLFDRLVASGATEDLARRWLEACGPAPSEAALARVIAKDIPAAPEPSTGPARIALVGPTGVGKTTTTAKLAARHALTERRKVGLITIDTYRIGAVEQLRTYARVMGLPLDVVQSPDEMPAALARYADKDVVLIDTVGRSPRRALHLAEIQAYLNVAEPTETHLVLSASSEAGYLDDTAEQFARLGTNRLIMTKLDEMPRWGVIAGIASRSGLPVSYITDGQEVPRNLRPARPDEIAIRIVGGVE